MSTKPGERHNTAIDDHHHNGVIDGLKRLCLHKKFVERFSCMAKLCVLKILTHKGLHYTDGSYILLHSSVEVIITEKYLGEKFHRAGNNHIKCYAENDQSDKEDEAHFEVDEHAHQHRKNHIERCPYRYTHQHLEGILQIGHICRHAGNQP